jgi:molybdopterin synthase catalytic subunit
MNFTGLHKKGEVDLNHMMADLSQLADYHKAGAVACFVGVVREDPVQKDDAKVIRLEYEAYTEVALRRMQEIRDGMKKKPGILEVSIHHIIDTLNVGEPSLFVAVLGKHRHEVFSALSETVERVKKEVPIWKKEFTSKQAYWVSNEMSQKS